MMNTFGNQLRKARNRLNVSQRELGKRSGYDAAHISNLESHKKNPSMDGIDRLAAALDIPPMDLVVGTELHGRYASERVSLSDQAIHERAERRRLSAKVVAIHEVYRRIATLFEMYLVGQILDSPDSHGEACFQYLHESLDEVCRDAAAASDGVIDLRNDLYVVESLDPQQYMVADLFFDNEQQAYDVASIRRSEALVLKSVFKYGEADDDTTRAEITQRLGLERVDRYIAEAKEERAAESAARQRAFEQLLKDK